jgi:hypothetical protein
MLDLPSKNCIIDSIEVRDVAQPGRAFALGAKGPVFESLYPDQVFRKMRD